MKSGIHPKIGGYSVNFIKKVEQVKNKWCEDNLGLHGEYVFHVYFTEPRFDRPTENPDSSPTVA